MKVPQPSNIPPKGVQPVVDKKSIRNEFSFSFKYFNQIDNFGLDKSDPKWFISLLDKLKEFANLHPGNISRNPSLKNTWRYHEIDWGAKNVPIQRKDLNWIEKDILENEVEFPMMQFQISKGTGRVVGFHYDNIFYVVLLDPLHNIQPSGDYEYKVDDCYPLSSQYTSLLIDIENVKKNKCKAEADCVIHKALSQIPTKNNQSNAFVAYIDDDYLTQLKEILEKKSFTELLKDVIISNS